MRKIPALLAVPFIALSLSACGTSSSGGGSSSSASETSSASEETSSSSSAETTDATTSEETTGSEETGGDSSGKPSRDEVKAGMKDVNETLGTAEQFTQLGVTEEQLDTYYGCITDNVYDSFSAESLRVIAEGDLTATISSDEHEAMLSASQTCGQQLAQELQGGSAG